MSDKSPKTMRFELKRDDVVRHISDLLAILENPEVRGVGFRIVQTARPRKRIDMFFAPLALKDRTPSKREERR